MSLRVESVLPLRAMEVRLQKTAINRFIEQMRKYADAFGFRAVVKPGGPDPHDIFLELLRDDVEVVASDSSDTGAPDLKYAIGFFPKRLRPAPPPEDVAPLFDALRLFLGQVPGLIISEER